MKAASILFLALALASCAEESSAVAPGPTLATQAFSEDDDLWAMIPAEADLALFADLAKLRDSPWTRESFAKASPGVGSDPAFAQMSAMDRLVFAKVPSLRDGATVLVAEGKVDREAMSKGFLAGGEVSNRSTYRGAELLVRGDEALAFLGKRLALSGFTLAVRAVLDCNAGLARAMDSESWFKDLRGQLDKQRPTKSLVASLYVHLQPATREALLREMGEGGDLEDFGGRIDLDADFDAAAIGVLGTAIEARDLAGRLGERIRDARTRPIVAAFGLSSVLDSLRFSAKGSQVEASLHISEKERSEISHRITMVTETLARMRADKPRADTPKDDKTNQENAQP